MDPDSSLFYKILFLLILIAINAFFAASEIAIISLNSQKIRKRAEEGDGVAVLLQNLLNEPSKFLATIQVGVTLSGLMASAVAAESFADQLVAWLHGVGATLDPSVLKLGSVILITLLLSFFTLVLGELVPKRLAMQNSEGIAERVVQPLVFFAKIAGPFVRLLSFATNVILRLFGMNPNRFEEKITEEEIRLMVDVGQEKGIIQSTEKEMIDNIFEFDNTFVSDIMTHRIDIVSLPIQAGWEEVLDVVIQEKFSRIPVYQETIDDIVGILHVQDLIPLLKNRDQPLDLRKISRKPYFVPGSKKTDELLKELQKNKTHMAVIIDEYGGTAGIVTIEDLLEEIVGNIFDEHDEVETEIERIDERTYLIDGTFSLDKIEELLDTDLPTEDYDTLSGFVIGELGRIPEPSERPEVEYHGILFKVESIDDKRIAKVRICLEPSRRQ